MSSSIALLNVILYENVEGSSNNVYDIASNLGVSPEVAKKHIELVGDKEPEEQEYTVSPLAVDLRDIKRVGSYFFDDEGVERLCAIIILTDNMVYETDADFNTLFEKWLEVKHGTSTYFAFQKIVNNE